MAHGFLSLALLFLAAYAFALAFSGSGAYEMSYAWDDDGMEDM